MTTLSSPASISVVIPTMNRAEVLLDTLNDLKVQDFADFEVIVVDQSDAPNPKAEALLADFEVPAHYYHVTQFRGLPEARNFGWRKARHDIIVYIDDDIRCGPEFLQGHCDAHVQTGAAIIAGGITEAKGDSARKGASGSFNWWTASPGSNFHFTKPTWCVTPRGANFSVLRSVLAIIGGFDENLTVGAALYEETEFALRARASGYDCWFAPDAHLVHLAAPMGGCRVGPDIQKYMFGMGHNRAILIFRHLPAVFRPTALVRMLMFGLSYSRAAKSLAPLWSAIRGMKQGRRAARAFKSETCPE